MAEAKAAQADALVERPDPAIKVWLFFGPDAGLVSERAEVISTKFGVDHTDPFALLRMDADVAADGGRLADEAGTIGMFGGSRLIRVSGSTRRNLAEALKPLLERPPVDCWVVIEAGDLKRDSALRRQVEKSTFAMAIPCYQDSGRDIDRLITAAMQAAALSIDAEARQALKANLGSDRKMSRNEIAKLALYCQGREKVTAADVFDLIGDTSAIAADDVIDAAATGNMAGLQDGLPRLMASGLPGDMVIVSALRHFQALLLARYRMDVNKVPAQSVVAALRPPLHFSRKPAFERALQLWNAAALARAVTRLDTAVLEARSKSGLGASLAGAELLAIAGQASRGGLKRN